MKLCQHQMRSQQKNWMKFKFHHQKRRKKTYEETKITISLMNLSKRHDNHVLASLKYTTSKNSYTERQSNLVKRHPYKNQIYHKESPLFRAVASYNHLCLRKKNDGRRIKIYNLIYIIVIKYSLSTYVWRH